jgi:hypothetical protein
MKSILRLFFLMVLFVIGSVEMAQSTLFVRCRDTAGNQLIYDSDLNITWYDFSSDDNYWMAQLGWAENIVVATADGTIYDDWRLPATVDGLWDDGYGGANITSSEMGHLYYTELQNIAYGGLQNTSPFEHLTSNWYWSGTEYANDPGDAWSFYFVSGWQAYGHADHGGARAFALAVRDGDVMAAPVPEPTSILLFGSGLVGFAGYIRKKFKQN